MGTRLADSVELDSVAGAVRASSSMRSINRSMRQVSGSFALADPIAFFCECEMSSCYSVVWMSAASFDAKVERRGGWLLAAAHTPSQLGPLEEPWSGVALSPVEKDAALDRCAQ